MYFIRAMLSENLGKEGDEWLIDGWILGIRLGRILIRKLFVSFISK